MEETRLIDRLAVSPGECAALLGLSRPVIYNLLNREVFPSFAVGTRRLIPIEGLRAWISQQTGGADDGA